ncbi:MAG: DUF4062 domain-containing protein [Verrucomicrobia bacterium]|nr:MAG: DUF4062 domain-containing protein [Verrucomicrobiota bacterium]
MSFAATAYNIMIACPSDVQVERNIVREVVHEWNVVNAAKRGVVLLPIGWETHSTPIMGDRPQALLNEQVLEGSDLLVAIFWTRIGTPTGAAPSGTVEEIQEHIKTGKPALVYFSAAPVRPDSVDEDQYKRLKEFRELCKKEGLIETYDDSNDFRQKFARHLAKTVNDHSRFANAEMPETAIDFPALIGQKPSLPQLSKEAMELLIEASQDPTGHIHHVRYIGGVMLQTNQKQFIEPNNPRSRAVWEGALQELQRENLIEALGYKGEAFQVTNSGYELAEILRK